MLTILSNNEEKTSFSNSKCFEKKSYENADKITYNNPQNTGNSIDNNLKVYGKCISVDYHFEGTEENNGMDWKTLRLVFKKYNGKYYLIGIINNEWTI